MIIPPVGLRIREERLKQGLSLRALARAVGVSASLISQIETGKSQPSVSTLYAITQSLQISVEDVFDAAERPIPAAVPAPSAAVAVAAALVQATGPLTRPGEREVLQLESGVTWERLGHIPGTHVDFLLVSYAPGGSSSGSGHLMRHGGVEHGYLLEGELTLTLSFEDYLLRPGDAVSFPSATPHRYRNDGEHPAKGVWFVYETESMFH